MAKSNTTPWMGSSGSAGTSKAAKPVSNQFGGGGRGGSFDSGFGGGGRGGSFGTPSPTPQAAPTPIAPISPISPNRVQGGGGGGGSVQGGATGRSYSSVEPSATGAMQAVEPMPQQAQTFDDWKASGGHAGDSTWGAENASAQSEYETLLASLAQQNTGFLNDWRGGLQSMGWDFGADGDRSGNWDADDTIGAYGQTRNNLVNDFSGRGMMDSTFYQEGLQNMDRRFNQQRDDMLRSYDNTQNEYSTNQAGALKSKEAAQQRALADAYSRYSSGYGI